MRKFILGSAALVSLLSAASLYGQDHEHMGHEGVMAQRGDDHRQLVNLPPPMRAHILTNMRDHLQSISNILEAISTNQFLAAANIASSRLGMDSPSGQACKLPKEPSVPVTSTPLTMEEEMFRLMPVEMRNAGLAMHKAASAFAVEARNASKTGNSEAVLGALSRVTQTCAVCHATFKMQ